MIFRIQTHKSANRVLRGGSWNNSATNCRVANRNNNDPTNRNNNNGFRVALSQLKRRGGCLLLNRFVVQSTSVVNRLTKGCISKSLEHSILYFY